MKKLLFVTFTAFLAPALHAAASKAPKGILKYPTMTEATILSAGKTAIITSSQAVHDQDVAAPFCILTDPTPTKVAAALQVVHKFHNDLQQGSKPERTVSFAIDTVAACNESSFDNGDDSFDSSFIGEVEDAPIFLHPLL